GRSVFRNARDVVPGLPSEATARAAALIGAPLERLADAGELALMRRLALYPRLVEAAALAHEPHRIAFYLYELASDFHAQWNRGKDSPHLRFIIQNDPQMTMARLALVQGVVTVLASGLGVLGVEAPEEMRESRSVPWGNGSRSAGSATQPTESDASTGNGMSMADDHTLRPYRSNDRYQAAEPSRSSEQAGGGDPLAELARLIGQRDPFAEFGRSNARQGQRPAP